mmetsp:Transcript_107055/g.309621  ORF Transcript_107055/g.309621 Transcript_107055/m.309621 type:complete len:396 (-) Transcript_107055:957-2144(-)
MKETCRRNQSSNQCLQPGSTIVSQCSGSHLTSLMTASLQAFTFNEDTTSPNFGKDPSEALPPPGDFNVFGDFALARLLLDELRSLRAEELRPESEPSSRQPCPGELRIALMPMRCMGTPPASSKVAKKTSHIRFVPWWSRNSRAMGLPMPKPEARIAVRSRSMDALATYSAKGLPTSAASGPSWCTKALNCGAGCAMRRSRSRRTAASQYRPKMTDMASDTFAKWSTFSILRKSLTRIARNKNNATNTPSAKPNSRKAAYQVRPSSSESSAIACNLFVMACASVPVMALAICARSAYAERSPGVQPSVLGPPAGSKGFEQSTIAAQAAAPEPLHGAPVGVPGMQAGIWPPLVNVVSPKMSSQVLVSLCHTVPRGSPHPDCWKSRRKDGSNIVPSP